jgi:rubrerythrin
MMIPQIAFGPDVTAERRPDDDVAVELWTLLRTHGQRESHALDAYAALVSASGDEGVRYLSRLILDDEERHHHMVAEMANRLTSELNEVELQPAVPAAVHGDAALLQKVRELLDLEQDDARELHRLRRQLRHEPTASLLPLLAELILHDTEKHIAILKFIRGHVEG